MVTRSVFRYVGAAALFVTALTIVWPDAALSYPAFGRQPYVSDGGPFCTGCHSSTDAGYQPELPADESGKLVFTEKHYKALGEGAGGFKLLSADERRKLLALAKKIDANASVSLDAPKSAAPGETITVTVTARGGIGPQVGIMLVDEPLRYQARPVQGAGWFIVGPPQVIGPDGKQQTTWVDRRYNKQSTNLNFILIYDVTSDPSRNSYPTMKVSYKLRAPQDSGEYRMTAAFLYGTADPDEMKTGKYVNPPGGITAPSGRVQFSNVVKVRVK
jgi:hypothetical protein